MLPLTRHGWPELIWGTLICIGLAAGLAIITPWLALLMVPPLVWLFAFFRDPYRHIPTEETIMVSPADGLVSDVEELPHVELLGGPGVRVGIFLSVFNVHINRAPCHGVVKNVIYKKGKFINAMSHAAASSDNESNTIVINDVSTDQPIAVVKQIVGLIARRIICEATTGTILERGERFGMIKFGSRTELYIPLTLLPTVTVKVGQKVRGGADIIARLGDASTPTNAADQEIAVSN